MISGNSHFIHCATFRIKLSYKLSLKNVLVWHIFHEVQRKMYATLQHIVSTANYLLTIYLFQEKRNETNNTCKILKNLQKLKSKAHVSPPQDLTAVQRVTKILQELSTLFAYLSYRQIVTILAGHDDTTVTVILAC
jgi:hypothetical protein